jgi:hypothetical protein
MSEDDTVARLRNLTNRLQERLTEAEGIRARLINARRESNSWPDLRPSSRPSGPGRRDSRATVLPTIRRRQPPTLRPNGRGVLD